MSTKRQPSKQRRQNHNQKQRAALEARRQAAATSQAAARPGGGGSGAAAPAAKGSVLSRLRGASTSGRAGRAGGTGGTGLPVGHRAALSAVFAALAAAVVGSLLLRMPVDPNGDVITTRGALVAEWTLSAADALADSPDASPAEVAASIDDWMPSGDQPYVQAYWPVSLAVVLPVIGTGLGLRAVSKRSSAKLVNRTMYVTLFGALLARQLLLIFLPAVISLAVAAFQVRKAEVTAARAAPPPGDAGAVIDVEEVDDLEEVDRVEEVQEVGEVDEVDEVDERS